MTHPTISVPSSPNTHTTNTASTTNGTPEPSRASCSTSPPRPPVSSSRPSIGRLYHTSPRSVVTYMCLVYAICVFVPVRSSLSFRWSLRVFPIKIFCSNRTTLPHFSQVCLLPCFRSSSVSLSMVVACVFIFVRCPSTFRDRRLCLQALSPSLCPYTPVPVHPHTRMSTAHGQRPQRPGASAGGTRTRKGTDKGEAEQPAAQ